MLRKSANSWVPSAQQPKSERDYARFFFAPQVYIMKTVTPMKKPTVISHREAREIALRLISGSFRRDRENS
jgi:hypothetical protein